MKTASEIATAFKQVESHTILELVEASGFEIEAGVLLDGNATPWKALSESKPDWRLAVEGLDSSWQVSLSAIRRHDISLVLVDGPETQVEKFCEMSAELPGFIQGRMFDGQYDRIQNLTSVAEFESAGLSTLGLELVSNGLPFPLEEMVVDTSKNPGRRLLRDGFIECIGHKMWIARQLVERLSIDLEKLASLGSVDMLPSGIRVTFSETPFTDDSCNEVQNAIREHLFGSVPVGQ